MKSYPEPDLFNLDCPSRDILELVGSKWAMLILCTLKTGAVRTGDLRRSVSGISQKMLTSTLRDLERNGIILRKDHQTVPPHVSYQLTDVGLSLSVLVKRMERWVVAHYQHALTSRRHFDKNNKLRGSARAREAREAA